MISCRGAFGPLEKGGRALSLFGFQYSGEVGGEAGGHRPRTQSRAGTRTRMPRRVMAPSLMRRPARDASDLSLYDVHAAASGAP